LCSEIEAGGIGGDREQREQQLAQLSKHLLVKGTKLLLNEVSVHGYYSRLIISLIFQTVGSWNVRSYSGRLGIGPRERESWEAVQLTSAAFPTAESHTKAIDDLSPDE
jgi:hypothetical protein